MQIGPPSQLGQLSPAPPLPPPTGIDTSEPPPPPPPWRATPAEANPWRIVAAVLVALWMMAVTVAAQGIGWLVDQALLEGGLNRPFWWWPAAGAVNAVLAGVPAALLAALPRSPALRTAGRAWLLAAGALGALGLVRAIPMPQNELYLAALALTAGSGALAVRRLRGRDRERQPTSQVGVLLAVAAGLATLLPWLRIGALGGLLESALAVAAAAAVGWLAAAILDSAYWAAFAMPSRRRARRLLLLGAPVAGVALLLIAAGVGQSGAQPAAMFVLPPVAFIAAALLPMSTATVRRPGFIDPGTPHRTRPPVAWLVALAAVGPLAFVDPEEISVPLIFGPRDVPVWVAFATAGSTAVALLLGLGYAVAFARGRLLLRRSLAAVAAAVMVLAATTVYIGLGQPGLHGERLFVVLRQQADLGGIPAGAGRAGRDDRVREVYRRLVDTAAGSQAALRRELDRWRLDYTPYYLVNAIEVNGGPAVRAWLSARDDVDRILLSQRLRPLPALAPATHGAKAAPPAPPWNLTMIGADRVWSELGVNGSGITVGAADSGVDGNHPALSAGFRGGDDSWLDPWNGTRAPTDRGGHGTHTLGTAVGARNVGVAPGAQWMACVDLDRNLGNPARYLDCLQFLLAPFPDGGNPFTDGRPDRAPQIVTNSWGCPSIEGCDAAALRPATAAFAAAGIFFVAAAGNAGPRCGSAQDPPAPYADVLTVGAVNARRMVTLTSGRGPAPGGAVKPDLVAPGDEVLSAMPGGGYAELSGTSMATPHVAGVVALMWSANPALVGDLARTRQILRDTATVAQPSYRSHAESDECGQDANITGAGQVDAYAAVRAARGAR